MTRSTDLGQCFGVSANACFSDGGCFQARPTAQDELIMTPQLIADMLGVPLAETDGAFSLQDTG
jgi:hypothetical protein